MILYEFEGKELLAANGISIPASVLLGSPGEDFRLRFPVVLKAQVMSGKRKDAGGIVICEKIPDFKFQISNLFGKTINNERVRKVLVEEKVAYSEPQYYLSISYDTDTRGPVLTISSSGGIGIEERGEVQTFPIDPMTQTVIPSKEGIQAGSPIGSGMTVIGDNLVNKLIHLFFAQDMLLLEINPLVKANGNWVALDAKIKLDDCAAGRHEWKFAPRSAPGHVPTENEIAAKEIDEGDYRGTAGSTYFDLAGDIAILASGGGASLTAMDALIKSGGRPANYTEYSGNPPKEKVAKLTQIVLSRPNIRGLWVVGAVANFTDIYETLSGFLEALRKTRPAPKYPIVIRRGGPRDKEAFEMLKEVKEFDLHLFGEETSITESAKIMSDLAKKYVATTKGR